MSLEQEEAVLNIFQVPDNGGDVKASGKNLVWSISSTEFDDGIFFYDGDNAEFFPDENRVTEITQLSGTNWSISPLDGPQISGDRVTWIGFGTYDSERNFTEIGIFLYDGSEITRLGNNAESPIVSGDEIVWKEDIYGGEFSDGNPVVDHAELLYYNGSETIKIADNIDDIYFDYQIAENYVIWNDRNNFRDNPEDYDFEIFAYDGSDVIQLTDNNISDDSILVSENYAVWRGSQLSTDNSGEFSDGELFVYDGNSVTQITDNNTTENGVQISGKYVIWFNDGVFLYDGNTTTKIFEEYTIDPQISGNQVVWYAYDGNDTEIFLYDGSDVIQLTNNEVSDIEPQISGDYIAWRQYKNNNFDSQNLRNSHPNDNHDLVLYDGNQTIQLTDDETNNYNSLYFELFEEYVNWTADVSDETGYSTEDYIAILPENNWREFYRFQNVNFELETDLYVSATEKAGILNNSDFNQTFELKGDNDFIFKACLEPGEDLLPFYRLQNQNTPGTYLYVSTAEYDSIFAPGSEQKDRWIKEGLNTEGEDIPDFYLYGVGASQGVEFHRFQNTENHTFLYATPEETIAINNDPDLSGVLVDEGVAFRALI